MASTNPPPPQNPDHPKDFLTHLEIYLSKRDGVDKLLKISRYAAKFLLASSLPAHHRLKSFESSVAVSRKALRLGKFIQDVNSLRATRFTSHSRLNTILSVIAYGGEGLYYFIEQLVWLAQAGLIDRRRLAAVQKWGVWCELVGYLGSVGLRAVELRKIEEEERCLVTGIEMAVGRGIQCGEEQEKMGKLRGKKMMKRLLVVQDLADGVMVLADVRGGRGWLSGPLTLASAGLLSAIISTHKNWLCC